MGVTPSKLVSEPADESREERPCRKRMIFSMVASWYSWDHLWAQRPVGQGAGKRELLAGGLCTHHPSSLDAIEAEHGLHVLGQRLRFRPLEAINDGHDVLATAQSSHNLLEKGGRRKRSASPKVHLDFLLTLCGRIKKYLVSVLSSWHRALISLLTSRYLGKGCLDSFRRESGGRGIKV